MDAFTTGRTTHLIQRPGVDDVAANNRLIEPIPRVISGLERWLVHLPTGRIEMMSPIMAELGDTIYVEYEPTADEIRLLTAGKAVHVTKQMLSRLRSTDDEVSVAERMELPQAEHARVREARYQRLHGRAEKPAEPAAPVATAKAAFTLPAEAAPAVPATFQLDPAPAL